MISDVYLKISDATKHSLVKTPLVVAMVMPLGFPHPFFFFFVRAVFALNSVKGQRCTSSRMRFGFLIMVSIGFLFLLTFGALPLAPPRPSSHTN